MTAFMRTGLPGLALEEGSSRAKPTDPDASWFAGAGLSAPHGRDRHRKRRQPMRTISIRHRQLSRLLAATSPTAAAVAAMILTAPAAQAISESTIQSECKAANGTYSTTVINGHRYSSCCYKDNEGNKLCDGYTDGTYTATYPDPGRMEPTAPPPVAQPGLPAPGTVAPGEPVMPGQGPQPVQPPPATEAPVIP